MLYEYFAKNNEDTMNKEEIAELKNELKEEENLALPMEAIIEQIEMFEKGIPPLKLDRPCTIDDGIKTIPESEHNKYINIFKIALDEGRVLKFVPASGAGSRMFKKQLSVLSKLSEVNLLKLTERANSGDKDCEATLEFIKNINRFAFYEALKKVVLNKGRDLDDLIKKGRIAEVITFVTDESGLNYANLPKGCYLFHNYPDGARTAFEEHLVEAINYAAGKDKLARAHFTISPEHEEEIKKIFSILFEKYGRKNWKFNIGFSFQSPSTDTISVTSENKPFRDEAGNIVFRPGGHGALLKNLNDLNADLILIKNIDNVVPDHLRDQTYRYKQILGGYLVSLQEKVFNFLNSLDQEDTFDEFLDEVLAFIKAEFGKNVPEEFNSWQWSEKKKYLSDFLNRPVRVCGMVKNEGHAGGGPFWVKNEDGNITKQVVESAQINHSDKSQLEIFRNATHFSPVDFACGVKDYKGNNFDLDKFSNPQTGLITKKSKSGKELKALELPGLWNGGMYNWLTVFIEVPKITFNPVKEINDLLKPEHQPPKKL